MKIIQDHIASKEQYEQREKSLPVSSVRFIFVCLHISVHECFMLFCVFKGQC